MSKSLFLSCFAALSLFATINAAYAGLITVVVDDELIGFDNITVGEETYNVRFVEGSFISIFGDATGLDFTTSQEAGIAALALMNAFNSFQIYDFAPSLTFGLTSDISGEIFTPWYFKDNLTSSRNFFNAGIQDQFDTVTGAVSMIATYDTSPGNNFSGARVWANWEKENAEQVPEPSTLEIFLLGMVSLLLRRFKKQ